MNRVFGLGALDTAGRGTGKVEPAHQIRLLSDSGKKTETELTAKACSSSPYSRAAEYQTVTLAGDRR